jgi:phosphoglycolate phosphatase
MRYSILSFDLDGTLVDTADEIAAAANATLAEFGLPPRPPAQITALIGRGTRELMLRLLERTLVERPLRAAQISPEAVLPRFEHHYAATAGTSARPYAGCQETLARLRSAGVRLACVTNKERRFAERVLRASGLDGAFALVVGGDSLAYKKPHASVLAHVRRALGGTPDGMAHVGDSRIDVESARNAGVAAWAVPWGYNGGEPIESAAPERLFRSLPEIADFVLAANDPGAVAAVEAVHEIPPARD